MTSDHETLKKIQLRNETEKLDTKPGAWKAFGVCCASLPTKPTVKLPRLQRKLNFRPMSGTCRSPTLKSSALVTLPEGKEIVRLETSIQRTAPG